MVMVMAMVAMDIMVTMARGLLMLLPSLDMAMDIVTMDTTAKDLLKLNQDMVIMVMDMDMDMVMDMVMVIMDTMAKGLQMLSQDMDIMDMDMDIMVMDMDM